MKKLFILFAACMIAVNGMGQDVSDSLIVQEPENAQIKPTMTKSDSLLKVLYDKLDEIEFYSSIKQRYKLYKTENIYNLLLLDTETGKIEQVQWSLDRSNEGTMTINNKDLTFYSEYGPGRFELYPTNNMYQFILLDKAYGRMWHVQWGLESAKRWIRPIY